MPQMVNTPVVGGGNWSGSGRGGAALGSMLGQLGSIILGAKAQKLEEKKYQRELVDQYTKDYYAQPELMEAMNPVYKEVFKNAFKWNDKETEEYFDTFQHDVPLSAKNDAAAKTEYKLNQSYEEAAGGKTQGEQGTTSTTPETGTSTPATTTDPNAQQAATATEQGVQPQTTDPNMTSTTSVPTEVMTRTLADGTQVRQTDPDAIPTSYDTASKKGVGTKWDGQGVQGEEMARTATGGMSNGVIDNPQAAKNYLMQGYSELGYEPAKASALADREMRIIQNDFTKTVGKLDQELGKWKEELVSSGYSPEKAQEIIDISRNRTMDYLGIVDRGQQGVQYRYEYKQGNTKIDAGDVEQRTDGLYFVPTDNMRNQEDISYYGGIQAYYRDAVRNDENKSTFEGYYNLVLKENRETLQGLYDEKAEKVPDTGALKTGENGTIIKNGELTDFGLRYMMDHFGSTDIGEIKLPGMGTNENVVRVQNPNADKIITQVKNDRPDPDSDEPFKNLGERSNKLKNLSFTPGQEKKQKRTKGSSYRVDEGPEAPYSSFYGTGLVTEIQERLKEK